MYRMEPIEIRTENQQDATIIHVHGEVDLATVPTLQRALRSAIQNGRHVVVDIANVTYIDLTGFRALVEVTGGLGERQTLALAGSSPLVHRVIEIIKLGTILPVFHSPREALDFVRSNRGGEN
jgi:anti-sigma B factor antagonist